MLYDIEQSRIFHQEDDFLIREIKDAIGFDYDIIFSQPTASNSAIYGLSPRDWAIEYHLSLYQFRHSLHTFGITVPSFPFCGEDG